MIIFLALKKNPYIYYKFTPSFSLAPLIWFYVTKLFFTIFQDNYAIYHPINGVAVKICTNFVLLTFLILLN